MLRIAAAFAALVGSVFAGAVAPADASLDVAGFRAVGVAHSQYPISAMAVAPDGRLFAAVQALGQTSGTTPGSGEIRVYSTYSGADGSLMDEGTTWATVDTVRATTNEEGLLGIALAPDFVTSRLVYVYLTTTDDSVNQQVRVYHETPGGTGELLGVVATGLEPPTESTNRNGGALTFGPDACLFVGVGDNGGNNRWNAQLPVGTDPLQGSENTALCTNVCLGTTEFPDRTITNDGQPNDAGKVLRLAVEGPSTAAGGPGNPLAKNSAIFSGGFRNPVQATVHPLTGQLYVSERGDTQQAEIDIVDSGTDAGWPCLEGGVIGASGVAACMTGHTPAEVYANHPSWRLPIATHAATPPPSVTGLAAYTGLAYPDIYYGDVFYLLRDSARIYRLDLEPPCFMPNPGGMTPLAFHDSNKDGDFTVFYDVNGDGNPDNVTLTVLTAIVQAPNPMGQSVLYIAGKQSNSSGLTDDTVIFRLEYATSFTPYAGPTGRVADTCYTSGPYSGGAGPAPYAYENPFDRLTCLPAGGPCPGRPDGTSCDDGDPCNGHETCQAGICTHGTIESDGTACTSLADQCHGAGVCESGHCYVGPVVPDGTPCPDGDPCNGLETCQAGVCQPASGYEPLTVKNLKFKLGNGALSLTGGIHPATTIAPESHDDLTFELRDANGVVFSGTLDHPSSDPDWRHRGRVTSFKRSGTGLTSVQLRAKPSGDVQVNVQGKGIQMPGLVNQAVSPRLVIGAECFTADLTGRCSLDTKKLRCTR